MKQNLAEQVPGRAWVVVFAGVAINLSWGILSAWSPGAKALINAAKAGQVITEGPARS
jgi:OFA family oxalate/formate antiporter-like MFS transporter